MISRVFSVTTYIHTYIMRFNRENNFLKILFFQRNRVWDLYVNIKKDILLLWYFWCQIKMCNSICLKSGTSSDNFVGLPIFKILLQFKVELWNLITLYYSISELQVRFAICKCMWNEIYICAICRWRAKFFCIVELTPPIYKNKLILICYASEIHKSNIWYRLSSGRFENWDSTDIAE